METPGLRRWRDEDGGESFAFLIPGPAEDGGLQCSLQTAPVLPCSSSSKGLNPPQLDAVVPLHRSGGIIGTGLLLRGATWLERV